MKKKLATLVASLLILAMAMPAYAANFVPSIEQKDGPEVIPQENSNGDVVDFIVLDDDDNEVTDFNYSDYELVVTGYGEKDDADEVIKDALEDAYEDVKDATPVSELSDTIKDAVEEALANEESLSGVTADDLVISDLFDVSLKDQDGNYTTFDEAGVTKAKVQLQVGDAAIDVVLFKGADGKWVVLDATLQDGIMTVILPEEGVLAFLEVSEDVNPEPGPSPTPTPSPKTGYESATGIIVATALCAATIAAIGLCVVADKKR